MPVKQVAWNPTTHVATVQADGDAVPAGSTKIGEFTDTSGDNRVYYHDVRDLLESEEGIVNMQFVSIAEDTTYVAVTGLSITPATVTLANGATQQITLTWTPTSPSNTNVTYTTSNSARATVSSSGLITAGSQDGAVTITATSEDGAFTDTVVVTVS